MLDFKPIFYYNMDMEDKIEINPKEEVVVTIDNLLLVIEGLERLSGVLGDISEEVSDKQGTKLMIPILTTFLCVVKMFPRKHQKKILALMKEDLGIDINIKDLFDFPIF